MGLYVEQCYKDEVTHLNNFHGYFNCSKIPGYPNGYYRTSFKRFQGIRFIELVKLIENSEEGIKDYCSYRSEKKLNQTPSELFEEIDKTAAEVGVNLDIVDDLIFKYVQYNAGINFEGADKSFEDLNTYIYPVYLALRRKGYNPEDFQG